MTKKSKKQLILNGTLDWDWRKIVNILKYIFIRRIDAEIYTLDHRRNRGFEVS
jgi:hypothetical protein